MAEKKKLRVAIADDEPHIRMLLKEVMTSMGAEIAGEATTGGEAVKLYRKERPHLMLLDINMPLKTGDEALGEILAEFPDAVVIMLTAAYDKDMVARCINQGASNYIRKDTSIMETKKIIKETWDQARKKGGKSDAGKV